MKTYIKESANKITHDKIFCDICNSEVIFEANPDFIREKIEIITITNNTLYTDFMDEWTHESKYDICKECFYKHIYPLFIKR
jgi:hypothetical protein